MSESAWQITDIDYTTLPEALRPAMKEHLRIEFPDDDASIRTYLANAIGYLEGFTDLRLFGTRVVWTPTTGQAEAQFPIWPVSAFTVATDADGEVTANYALRWTSLTTPWWLAKKDGTAIEAGTTVNFTAGYADPGKIGPALLGNVLRIAATLYENRESVSMLSPDQMPLWLNDMLGGLWIPRA
jgi:uncharacterized phiE125 gp8 family phage protein